MDVPALGRESLDDRIRFIRDSQLHCDYRLANLADPRGKKVLVVGCGAGTEMYWCLQRGATEVVGIDILEQNPEALATLVRDSPQNLGPFSFLQMAIESAGGLNRQFDLVLSNNAFEHVGDVFGALKTCQQLTRPGGRVAIFTDPLYYSSQGSHLEIAPWEHLWGELGPLRNRLIASSSHQDHPLNHLNLAEYLSEVLSLNQLVLGEFIEAVRSSQLVLLHLELIKDRQLPQLRTYIEPIMKKQRSNQLSAMDLALEGLAVELLRLPDSPVDDEGFWTSTRAKNYRDEIKTWEDRYHQMATLQDQHRQRAEQLKLDLVGEKKHRRYQQQAAEDLQEILAQVQKSLSFRLGRFLTAPFRWMKPENSQPRLSSDSINPKD